MDKFNSQLANQRAEQSKRINVSSTPVCRGPCSISCPAAAPPDRFCNGCLCIFHPECIGLAPEEGSSRILCPDCQKAGKHWQSSPRTAFVDRTRRTLFQQRDMRVSDSDPVKSPPSNQRFTPYPPSIINVSNRKFLARPISVTPDGNGMDAKAKMFARSLFENRVDEDEVVFLYETSPSSSKTKPLESVAQSLELVSFKVSGNFLNELKSATVEQFSAHKNDDDVIVLSPPIFPDGRIGNHPGSGNSAQSRVEKHKLLYKSRTSTSNHASTSRSSSGSNSSGHLDKVSSKPSNKQGKKANLGTKVNQAAAIKSTRPVFHAAGPSMARTRSETSVSPGRTSKTSPPIASRSTIKTSARSSPPFLNGSHQSSPFLQRKKEEIFTCAVNFINEAAPPPRGVKSRYGLQLNPQYKIHSWESKPAIRDDKGALDLTKPKPARQDNNGALDLTKSKPALQDDNEALDLTMKNMDKKEVQLEQQMEVAKQKAAHHTQQNSVEISKEDGSSLIKLRGLTLKVGPGSSTNIGSNNKPVAHVTCWPKPVPANKGPARKPDSQPSPSTSATATRAATNSSIQSSPLSMQASQPAAHIKPSPRNGQLIQVADGGKNVCEECGNYKNRSAQSHRLQERELFHVDFNGNLYEGYISESQALHLSQGRAPASVQILPANQIAVSGIPRLNLRRNHQQGGAQSAGSQHASQQPRATNQKAVPVSAGPQARNQSLPNTIQLGMHTRANQGSLQVDVNLAAAATPGNGRNLVPVPSTSSCSRSNLAPTQTLRSGHHDFTPRVEYDLHQSVPNAIPAIRHPGPHQYQQQPQSQFNHLGYPMYPPMYPQLPQNWPPVPYPYAHTQGYIPNSQLIGPHVSNNGSSDGWSWCWSHYWGWQWKHSSWNNL